MKEMKIKCLMMLFLCVWATLCGQAQPTSYKDSASVHMVYVRYVAPDGGARTIRGKNKENHVVIIRDDYVLVNDDIFRRIKHRSCATYRYDYQQDNTFGCYTVKAKAKKTAFGFTASLLNYQWKSEKYQWICGQYMPNFSSVRFIFHDYAGGLYFDRQLCAKNRHRFSMEFVPVYRHVVNTIFLDGYETSYSTVDPDGDNYTRYVTIDNYVEKQRQHCASMMICLRYDWYCFKHLSLFVSAGVDNTFSIAQKYDVSYDAKYAGYYEDEYFNVLIDRNGYYDFGSFPANTLQHAGTDGFYYTLHGTATAGLQLFLGNTLSLEVSALYYRKLYSNMDNNQYSAFHLLSDEQDYKGMVDGMNRMLLNRFGFNCKLKFSF